jgi:hypothetical protein
MSQEEAMNPEEILARSPRVKTAVEHLLTALHEYQQIEAELVPKQQSNLVDPSAGQKIHNAQFKLVRAMDTMVSTLKGEEDQEVGQIAMAYYQKGMFFVQSFVFSLHYARITQRFGNIGAFEYLLKEAYALLSKNQERSTPGKGKIVTP